MRTGSCLLFASLFAAHAAHAAAPAAEVTMAVGLNTATAPGGAMRELKRGDGVFVQETLGTGPNSYLNIRLTDGSFVLLRPASRFVIDKYTYVAADRAADAAPARANAPAPRVPAAPDAPKSGVLMRLMRGGFRAVSGAIGHRDPDAYQVNTPIATIGIRGTDYVAVLCDAACALDPVVAQGLPAGAIAEDSLIAGVIEGSIVLTGNEGGAQSPVMPDQYVIGTRGGGFSTLAGQPRFLRTDPIPNPRTCQ